MSNFFNFQVAANATTTLITDITKITTSQQITFCIKFEDIANYPSYYNLNVGISDVTIQLLGSSRSGNQWSIKTSNNTVTYSNYPTYVTLLLDATNNTVGIYADGVELDTISDTVTLSSSSNLVVTNSDASTANAEFSEVLFFDRLLTSSEALLASSGFSQTLSVTIPISNPPELLIQGIDVLFPNVSISVGTPPVINIETIDVIVLVQTRVITESQQLIVTPYAATINDFGNVYVDVNTTLIAISSEPIIETPEDYVVQHWSFIADDGSPTKFDTTGNNGFTDSETSVRADLPEVISLPLNYLYYRPVWDSSNYNSGNGTITVAGEAQLQGLVAGSKSFSFWIYRPFIADVTDNTIITIDGDYAFNVSPSFGNTPTVNGNWSLVVIVYDEDVNERRMYIDNSLYDTDFYAEVGNGKITLCDTQMGEVDVKVAIRDIKTYSYALTTTDIDLIYNFYYKYLVIRPDVSEVKLQSLFTEAWYYKCDNGLVIDVISNQVRVNEFINIFKQDVSKKLTVLPLEIQDLSVHISRIRIIALPPETVGEAYLDFEDTTLCDLYYDTPHYDISLGVYVGLRFITTVLVPYQIDKAYYSNFETNEDLTLYSNERVKSIVYGFVNNTYGAEYVVRVNNRGYALSTSSGKVSVSADAVTHSFVFALFTAPTNYCYVFDIGGVFQMRVMSDLSIQVSKDYFNTYSTVPIQPLELNKEYIIKINYLDGIYLNSYQILSGYSDTQYNTSTLRLESFGGVSFDTNSDVMDGYVCNYKTYTLSLSYYFNYVSYIGNIGVSEVMKLFDITKEFIARGASYPTLPHTKNVMCKYKTMPNMPELKIVPNNLDYVGEVHVTTVVSVYPATMIITQNFLKPPKNVYLSVTTTSCIITSLQKVCEFVNPIPTKMNVDSAAVRIGDLNKRVCMGIDNIIFTHGLKLSASTIIDTIISKTSTMVDGSTLVSATRKPKFAQQAILYSDTNNYEHYDIIDDIKNNINSDTHTMYFSDGSFIEFKYDLLTKTFECEPIYEGSDYFKLKIRVLK